MKKALILVLSPLFLIGVFGDELMSESVSVTEGESVTLQTGVTELQKGDGIEWRFNGTRIAKISSGFKGILELSSADVTFRSRLQLDNQTGDLTITNIKTTDSGEYKLKISRTTTSEKIFIVNGVASADKDPVKSVAVQEGDSVTLHTKIQRDDVIRWMFGRQNSLIGEINRKTENVSTHGGPDERFRDRLQMDYLTGSLTIRNIRTEHSGLYEVDISRDGYTIHKSFSVTVRDGLKSLSVSEGESVTLNTDLTEIQTDVVIRWMFRDTQLAEILKAKQYTSDGPDLRFKDRLKLDQTGSLTIMNIRTTDFGLYELTISGRRFTIHRKITVTVTDLQLMSVKEGGSVHLQTGVTEKQRNDQILWKFGDQVIPTDRLKDPKVGTTWSNTYLNEQTGDLNITNIRGDQFGDYKVEIITGSTILHKKFRIMIGSGLSAGEAVGMCVACLVCVVVVLFVGAWIYYRYWISKLKRKMKEILSVIKGESVTLNPDGIKIRKDDIIRWKYEGALLAERKANGEITEHDDVLDKRFKDQLHLNKDSGSLTIKKTRLRMSGRYELWIIRRGHHLLNTFRVAVFAPKDQMDTVSGKEEEPVTLHTGVSGIQKDDQIQWVFVFRLEDYTIAQIKGGNTKSFPSAAGWRFIWKLNLDHQTGSLTIKKITSIHTGFYIAYIIRGGQTTMKLFRVQIKNPDDNTHNPNERISLKDVEDSDSFMSSV